MGPLIIVIIVIAGWIFLSRNANSATSGASGLSDGPVPVNTYDNPYDTDENNDRPFEPDSCSDSSDDSSSDTCDSSDSSSSD